MLASKKIQLLSDDIIHLTIFTWCKMASLEKNRTAFLTTVCLVVFLVAYYSPVDTSSSDPLGSLLTSQAILEHGSIRLDAYRDSISRYITVRQKNGHYYYYYPLGTSLAALPFVWVANLLGYDMADADQLSQSRLQNFLSALTSAVTCFLLFFLARRDVDEASSYILTLTFFFGSSLISSLGTGLWSFNLEILCILGVLLLLNEPFAICKAKQCGIFLWISQAAENPLRVYQSILIGSLLFLAYLSRPTALVFLLVIFLYLLFRHRSAFLIASMTCLILGGLYIGYNLSEYGQPLPDYYLPASHLRGGERQLLGLYILFLSPSRGLLIFSPFLIAVMINLALNFRQTIQYLWVWIAGFWIAGLAWIAASQRDLTGGWSYGARILTDALPAFFILSLISWEIANRSGSLSRWKAYIIAFACLAGIAVMMNTVAGILNPWSMAWNPASQMDKYPQVVYDWRYPQFLANEAMIANLELEQAYRDIRVYRPGEVITPTSKKVAYSSWYGVMDGELCRWTAGHSSRMALKLDPRDWIDNDAVALQVNAGTYRPQEISVLINGRSVGTIDSKENWTPDHYYFRFNRDLLGISTGKENGYTRLVILFVIPGASSPARDDPSSDDNRLLGLCLHGLVLQPR